MSSFWFCFHYFCGLSPRTLKMCKPNQHDQCVNLHLVVVDAGLKVTEHRALKDMVRFGCTNTSVLPLLY